MNNTSIGCGKALMLSEAAQTRYFPEEGDTVNGFPIDLIPLGEDMRDVGIFTVYLFISAPIIFNYMLRR
jgi:hypothetical protein